MLGVTLEPAKERPAYHRGGAISRTTSEGVHGWCWLGNTEAEKKMHGCCTSCNSVVRFCRESSVFFRTENDGVRLTAAMSTTAFFEEVPKMCTT